MYSKILAMKEIREAARSVGLTFKRSGTKLNQKNLYQLAVRNSSEIIINNYSFSGAYEDYCSGYISSWDGIEFTLRGQDMYPDEELGEK